MRRPAKPSSAQLMQDVTAATALEYALIAAIMAMAITTGVSLFGSDASLTYGKISDTLGLSQGLSPAGSATAPGNDPGNNQAGAPSGRSSPAGVSTPLCPRKPTPPAPTTSRLPASHPNPACSRRRT